MQTLGEGYKSISFLVGLNGDRLVMVGVMIAALWLGSHIALV